MRQKKLFEVLHIYGHAQVSSTAEFLDTYSNPFLKFLKKHMENNMHNGPSCLSYAFR